MNNIVYYSVNWRLVDNSMRPHSLPLWLPWNVQALGQALFNYVHRWFHCGGIQTHAFFAQHSWRIGHHAEGLLPHAAYFSCVISVKEDNIWGVYAAHGTGPKNTRRVFSNCRWTILLYGSNLLLSLYMWSVVLCLVQPFWEQSRHCGTLQMKLEVLCF